MINWVWVLFLPALFLLVLWALDAFLALVFGDTRNQSTVHEVQTSDGRTISVHHYSAAGDTEGHKPPVLLVHGLSANHRNLAYNEQSGLAQFLNAEGYDCWAVGLRGRNLGSFGNWTFDEYVSEDLPATIDYVIDRSEDTQVHWVGHSMGGMSYLACAGSLGYSDRIKSGVTIGSPVFFRGFRWIKKIGETISSLPDRIGELLTWILGGLFRVIIGLLPWRVLFLVVLESRFSRRALQIVYNVVVPRIQPQVLWQFMGWIASDEWTSRDNQYDYRQGLKQVDSPTLTVVGNYDRFCPDCTTAGYDLLEVSEKDCLMMSPDDGARRDYDHLELVFSRDAQEDVFPEIASWLDQVESK